MAELIVQRVAIETRTPVDKTQMRPTLPIAVVVCTLNEALNIEECLEAIFAGQPAEVWVIDGSSDDNTVELAQKKGATVIVCERRGLAYQRFLGVAAITQPYLAFVDADDVPDPDCLAAMLADLRQHGAAAVQAISRAYRTDTYWEKAMESLNQLRSRQPGPSRMVGRPALYDTAVLRQIGIDPHWGRIGNEDTDLAIRYEMHAQPMRIAAAYSARKHARTLAEWLVKWRKYGRGDAKIIKKYPHKRRAILHHQLINYPLLLSVEAARKGYGWYIPFYVLFGWGRFLFMAVEIVSEVGRAITAPHNRRSTSWPE